MRARQRAQEQRRAASVYGFGSRAPTGREATRRASAGGARQVRDLRLISSDLLVASPNLVRRRTRSRLSSILGHAVRQRGPSASSTPATSPAPMRDASANARADARSDTPTLAAASVESTPPPPQRAGGGTAGVARGQAGTPVGVSRRGPSPFSAGPQRSTSATPVAARRGGRDIQSATRRRTTGVL